MSSIDPIADDLVKKINTIKFSNAQVWVSLAIFVIIMFIIFYLSQNGFSDVDKNSTWLYVSLAGVWALIFTYNLYKNYKNNKYMEELLNKGLYKDDNIKNLDWVMRLALHNKYRELNPNAEIIDSVVKKQGYR